MKKLWREPECQIEGTREFNGVGYSRLAGIEWLEEHPFEGGVKPPEMPESGKK